MTQDKFPKERDEHPFAKYVRTLGKGKKGSRSLTPEEAFDSFSMILQREVTPEQLGAYLMLLRIKEETPEEICAFVNATQKNFNDKPCIDIDLDWSSYAGKRRHLPWYLLACFALADSGIKIFMHGAAGHTEGRLYTADILKALNVNISNSWEQTEQDIENNSFSYMPLKHISPVLAEIIDLRSILGLRSPVHSMARLINPLSAKHVIQGVFHPAYNDIHQQASALLNYESTVIKGEGGETERNPERDLTLYMVRNQQSVEEKWPRRLTQRQPQDKELSVQDMLDLWRDDKGSEYAIEAVIGTIAIALRTMNKACDEESAYALANDVWAKRNKQRI
jgi:anthranilate phosphoribosyltransferase